MLKKSRFPVAITLLVQSFTFLILFIILSAKKKSIASAFLAVAAMEGAAGTYLLSQMKKEIAETVVDFGDDDFEVDEAAINANLSRCDDDRHPEDIPCADASEDEFN